MVFSKDFKKIESGYRIGIGVDGRKTEKAFGEYLYFKYDLY